MLLGNARSDYKKKKAGYKNHEIIENKHDYEDFYEDSSRN